MIAVLLVFIIPLIFVFGFSMGTLSEKKDLRNVARAIGEKNDIYAARSPGTREQLLELKALMEGLDTPKKKQEALERMTTCVCDLCGKTSQSTASGSRGWDDPYFGLPWGWEWLLRGDAPICPSCVKKLMTPSKEEL